MNEWLVSCVPPWSRYRMRGHSTEHNHKQHMQGQDRTTLGHRLYEKSFASDSPVFLRFKRYNYSLLTSYTHAVRYWTTYGTSFMHHAFYNTASCPFIDLPYRCVFRADMAPYWSHDKVSLRDLYTICWHVSSLRDLHTICWHVSSLRDLHIICWHVSSLRDLHVYYLLTRKLITRPSHHLLTRKLLTWPSHLLSADT